jgi:hypothetical protein
MREGQQPRLPASPPLVSLETRSRLTICWLAEVLTTPSLLRGFAQDALDDEDCTLAVLAPYGASLDPLIGLVESDQTIERCDVTVLTEPASTPARALLAARSSSQLTLESSEESYAGLPLHEAAERLFSSSSRAAA